jgi:hypothetical protein
MMSKEWDLNHTMVVRCSTVHIPSAYGPPAFAIGHRGEMRPSTALAQPLGAVSHKQDIGAWRSVGSIDAMGPWEVGRRLDDQRGFCSFESTLVRQWCW